MCSVQKTLAYMIIIINIIIFTDSFFYLFFIKYQINTSLRHQNCSGTYLLYFLKVIRYIKESKSFTCVIPHGVKQFFKLIFTDNSADLPDNDKMISCYDSSKKLYHNSFIGRKLFHRHKWINRNSKFINKWLQLHSQHFFIQYFLSKSCTKSEYIGQNIKTINQRSLTVNQAYSVATVLLLFP